MESVPEALDFQGPYSIDGGDGRGVFDPTCLPAKHPGVYLWLIPYDDGYAVNYVGQTGRPVRKRIGEEVRDILGGTARVRDLPARPGDEYLAWNPQRKTAADFLREYESVRRPILDYVLAIRLLIAPMPKPESALLKRIETALILAARSDETTEGLMENAGVSAKRVPTKTMAVRYALVPRGMPTTIQV